MARNFDDASSQYLSQASLIVSALPFTFAGWTIAHDFSINHVIVSFVKTPGGISDNHFHHLRFQATTGAVRALSFDNVASAFAESTANASINTWHHICGVWAASNDRRVYLDGGSKGTSATDVTVSGLTDTWIGLSIWDGAPSGGHDGIIARVGIWDVALTDAEALMLSKGAMPWMVRKSNLQGYWEILGASSPEPDWSGGGFAMSLVNSPPVAPHVPLKIFPYQIWTPYKTSATLSVDDSQHALVSREVSDEDDYVLRQQYVGTYGMPTNYFPELYHPHLDLTVYGAGDVLTVDDSTHILTSDNVDLTQHHTLSVDDSTHILTSDNIDLVQKYLLSINDSTHALTSDNIDLTQSYLLSVNNSTHIQTSDNIDLIQNSVLFVNSATHILTSDNVSLTQHNILSINDSIHLQITSALFGGILQSDPIGYWTLGELSGSIASNYGSLGEDASGSYVGVDLDNTSAPGGTRAPYFDGANDVVNIYSTALRDAFNKSQGSIFILGKTTTAARTDGVIRRLASLFIDGSNFVIFAKTTTDDAVQASYRADGNPTENIQTSASPLDQWLAFSIIWDSISDKFLFYVNDILIGETTTIGGELVGTLNPSSTVIGATNLTPANVFDGWLAHAAIYDRVLEFKEIRQLYDSMYHLSLQVNFTLSVDDSIHAVESDNIDLIENNVLSVDNASHSLTSDNVSLTQNHSLSANDSIHTLTSDNINLGLAGVLSVQNSTHILTSDNVSLTQHNTLSINDSTHLQISSALFGSILQSDPIGYWTLGELSGSIASNYGSLGEDASGSYVGVDLADTSTPGGTRAPYFDGANDRTNIYSTSFRDAIDGSVGTVAIWGKVDSAAIWTDNVYHFLFTARANPITDGFVLVKGSSTESNQLIWEYEAGDVQKQVFLAVTPTDWFYMAMSWDKTADEVKAYYNGVQTGATQTGLGNWGGPIDANFANIGCHNTPPALVWKGWLAHASVYDRALKLSEIRQLYESMYHLSLRVRYTLSVDNATHIQTADNVDLTQNNLLSVEDAIHVQTSDNVDLTQNHVLGVTDSIHVLTSDNVDLVEHEVGALSVEDTINVLTSDSVTLIQHSILSVDDSIHALTSDNISLIQTYSLSVNSAIHVQTADNVDIIQGYLLSPKDSIHTLTSDDISLTQHNILDSNDSIHILSSDNIDLVEHAVGTVSADDSIHVLTSDNIVLTQHNILSVDNSTHIQTADNVELVQNFALSISDSEHVLYSDNVILIFYPFFVVSDSIHTQTSDNVTLVQHNVLSVEDCVHIQTADNITVLFRPLYGIPTPYPSRTFDVVEEDRVYIVQFEDRHYDIE